MLLEHNKSLTRIALTSNSQTEYAMMNTMYKIVESSHKIAKDPVLRQKHRKLLRNKTKQEDFTMENIKSEYDKIVEDRKNIQQELEILKENEFVKRYFELSKIDASLQIEQNRLYTLMKLEEFSSCEHLWVTCKVDHRYCGAGICEGCIKCGLNEEILCRDYNSIKTIDEAAMYDVLNDISVRRGGISLNVLCDLELAKAIYSKIIENNPNIDDEMACKYFEIALDNIRNIEVSDERKVSRAKRLSLNPNFNRWNRNDIKNRK